MKLKVLDTFNGENFIFKKYDIPHEGKITLKSNGNVLVEHQIGTYDYERVVFRERQNEGLTPLDKWVYNATDQLQRNGLGFTFQIAKNAATGTTV